MSNGNVSGEVWGMFGVVCGLLLFGSAYNAFVSWLEDRGYHEGYVAFLVVGGNLVTLAGMEVAARLVDWSVFVVGFICFAASGLPMVLGSAWRHAHKREQKQRLAHRESKVEAMLGDMEMDE